VLAGAKKNDKGGDRMQGVLMNTTLGPNLGTKTKGTGEAGKRSRVLAEVNERRIYRSAIKTNGKPGTK